jgi:hypothetical protein
VAKTKQKKLYRVPVLPGFLFILSVFLNINSTLLIISSPSTKGKSLPPHPRPTHPKMPLDALDGSKKRSEAAPSLPQVNQNF